MLSTLQGACLGTFWRQRRYCPLFPAFRGALQPHLPLSWRTHAQASGGEDMVCAIGRETHEGISKEGRKAVPALQRRKIQVRALRLRFRNTGTHGGLSSPLWRRGLLGAARKDVFRQSDERRQNIQPIHRNRLI